MQGKVITSTLLIFGLFGLASIAHGQKTKTLGQTVSANQLVSFDRIDHSSYDALLQRYVDEDGDVDYRSWRASDEDRRKLQAYINSLSAANPNARSSRESALAFWINAYNAVTIEGILQVYPTTSIRNHTAKLGGYNIWKDLHLNVAGTGYSLDSIEHDVLRKMNEPRIHFAIVCASIGCPRLMNRAYVGETLEQQLQTNARDFFSRRRHLQIDASTGTLKLSSIISWFGKDFGSDTRAQLTYLAPYFPEQARQFVARGGFRVGYLDYDWNLNEKK